MTNKRIAVGYDFDGVLCKKFRGIGKRYKLEELHRAMASAEPTKYLKKACRENAYIITGRRFIDKKVTEEWLEKHGADVLKSRIKYLREARAKRNIIAHKLKWIKKLRIKVFYEDDKEIARILRKRLPDVKVIEVELV